MGLFDLFKSSNKTAESSNLVSEDLDTEPFFCDAESFESHLQYVKAIWDAYLEKMNKDSQDEWRSTIKMFVFQNAELRRYSLRPDLSFSFDYDTWYANLPPKWRKEVDSNFDLLVMSDCGCENSALWEGCVEPCLRLVQASVNAAEEVFLSTPDGISFAKEATEKYNLEQAARDTLMPINLPIPFYGYVADDDESYRGEEGAVELGSEDPWFDKAYKVIRDNNYKGSVSRLQKVFRMGYTRAMSMLSVMYDQNLIPPADSTIDQIEQWKRDNRKLVEKNEDLDIALVTFPQFRPALARSANLETLEDFWYSDALNDPAREFINDMEWEKEKLDAIQKYYKFYEENKQAKQAAILAQRQAEVREELRFRELVEEHSRDQARQHNAQVDKTMNDLRYAEMFNTGQERYLRQEIEKLIAKK